MKKEFVGIDISKKTFDAWCFHKNVHRVFLNEKSGYLEFMEWFDELNLKLKTILFCMENTGMYSFGLSSFLDSVKCDYVIESAIQIKRSIGLKRGKNDKVDAFRISEYAYLRRNQLVYSKSEMQELTVLRKLLTHRDKMVAHRKVYRDNLKEFKQSYEKIDLSQLFASQETLIQNLNEQIKLIEKQITTIIESDNSINEKYELATSVKGVGPILGTYLIISTGNFTKFNDPRKYACYTGVAPFQYNSGTSILLKTRVNKMADKKLKSLLNLAARSAVCHDSELRRYYLRKVEEGKNKMSVLNGVRNKIIHRVFAVIKRKTPYVILQNY